MCICRCSSLIWFCSNVGSSDSHLESSTIARKGFSDYLGLCITYIQAKILCAGSSYVVVPRLQRSSKLQKHQLLLLKKLNRRQPQLKGEKNLIMRRYIGFTLLLLWQTKG